MPEDKAFFTSNNSCDRTNKTTGKRAQQKGKSLSRNGSFIGA
jgi:hypothetical protein